MAMEFRLVGDFCHLLLFDLYAYFTLGLNFHGPYCFARVRSPSLDHAAQQNARLFCFTMALGTPKQQFWRFVYSAVRSFNGCSCSRVAGNCLFARFPACAQARVAFFSRTATSHPVPTSLHVHDGGVRFPARQFRQTFGIKGIV